MPEYLSPAVYVEEVDSGAKPIEGVSTSTAGMVGVTERGPVGVPILVTSFGEYQRLFGEFLNELDYPPPNNFLPHAVEGFFTNLGQRVYIVRVLDAAGAVHANTILYDRGTATSADTVLLRSADAGTGPAGTVLPYVLDATSINIGDWLRLGQGTPAEYRPVAGTDTDEHVSFDLPLMQSHDAGVTVEEVARAADAAYAGPEAFALDSDAAAGTAFVSVTNAAAADITILVAAGGQLIAVGGEDNREEYRFVVSATVDPGNPNRADVELDEPLALPHSSGARVSALAVGAASAADTLETAAAAGTAMIFLGTTGSAAAFSQDSLLVVDGVEVRRIGDFGALDVSAGAYESYGREVLLRVVETADTEETGGPARALIAPPPVASDSEINVDDITGLEVGHSIRISGGADVDDVFITNITPGAAPAGVLEFDPPLQNGYAVADSVVRIFAFRLTQDATTGTPIIAVDRRADIADGQLLRIGDTPDDEYVRINDIPDHDPGSPPDDGNVVLDHAVRNTHTTGTIVYLSNEPTLTASRSHASMTLTADENDRTFHISDGGAGATLIQGAPVPDLIELRNDVGERFYHRVVGVANPFTPAVNVARIELANPPLARSHGIGDAVLGRDTLFDVQALDAGIWGNRIRIAVEDEPRGLVQNTQLQLVNVTSPTEIRLDSALGVEEGTILEFRQNDAVVGDLQKVDAIDRRTGQITLAGAGLDAAQTGALVGGPLAVRSREFQLGVYLLRQPDPAVPTRNETVLDSEVFRNLSMDPRHSRYLAAVIGDLNGEVRLWDRRPRGESQYIRVSDINPDTTIRLGPEPLVDVLSSGREEAARRSLLNGFDSIGTLSAGAFVGVNSPEPEDRTGIQALRNYEDISIVAAPGQIDSNIQRELIEHCEEERFRFAVLDGPAPPADTLTDVLTQRQLFDTKYAALYHPRLLIDEPFPVNLADIRDYPIPPAGHVIGVYARTDVERGVHKSPANELVRGITGLQRVINKREHDLLNPYPTNINVIRDFRDNNRGIRVWGGRVITSDTDWKYVNVRRLLIFIEHSIERGLQWVVFEPNSEPTWARVRRAISNFLTVVWRNGALEGTTVEEAYFVRCDRTTMTQTDIDNGRLICQVGVAPVKPAEFVIIRIGLWTAHAETE